MYLYTWLTGIHDRLYSFTHQSTPLHLAAHAGRLDTVQHLVEKGADLNIRSVDGVSE